MPARALRGVAILTTLVLGGCLVACGWFSWPSTDDFCIRALTSTLGVTGGLDWTYHETGGRLATNAALLAVVATVAPPHLNLVSAAFGAAVLLISWQIAAFVRPAGRDRIGLFALVAGALALGLYPLLAQTVYWTTGAMVYWLPLLLLLHWLRITRDALRGGPTSHRAHGIALGILLGVSFELVVPIALLYAVTVAARQWKQLDRAGRQDAIVRVASVLVGFAILASAPGNYLRAAATPGSFSTDAGFLALSYGSILRAAIATSPVLPAIALVLGLSAAGVAARRPRPLDSGGRLVEAAALALGAFASLLPLLAAPAQFAPRNSLYLLVTLLVAGLLAFDTVTRSCDDKRIGSAYAVVAIVLSTIAIARLVPDLGLAPAYRSEHLARDRALRSAENAGQDVVVGPIRAPAPRTLHAIDIGPDPKDLVNWCVAKTYGLHSIELGGASR